MEASRKVKTEWTGASLAVIDGQLASGEELISPINS
jgi:hypothetical protein